MLGIAIGIAIGIAKGLECGTSLVRGLGTLLPICGFEVFEGCKQCTANKSQQHHFLL